MLQIHTHPSICLGELSSTRTGLEVLLLHRLVDVNNSADLLTNNKVDNLQSVQNLFFSSSISSFSDVGQQLPQKLLKTVLFYVFLVHTSSLLVLAKALMPSTAMLMQTQKWRTARTIKVMFIPVNKLWQTKLIQ